jgi:hypothetical protein
MWSRIEVYQDAKKTNAENGKMSNVARTFNPKMQAVRFP